jgi:hypothetical protein
VDTPLSRERGAWSKEQKTKSMKIFISPQAQSTQRILGHGLTQRNTDLFTARFARGTEYAENWLAHTDVEIAKRRDKPFDPTPFDLAQGLRQGHESFDYAQDPEVLEGQCRMASLPASGGLVSPFFSLHIPSLLAQFQPLRGL